MSTNFFLKRHPLEVENEFVYIKNHKRIGWTTQLYHIVVSKSITFLERIFARTK